MGSSKLFWPLYGASRALPWNSLEVPPPWLPWTRPQYKVVIGVSRRLLRPFERAKHNCATTTCAGQLPKNYTFQYTWRLGEILRHKAFPNFIFRIQNVTVLQRPSEDGYLKMTVPNTPSVPGPEILRGKMISNIIRGQNLTVLKRPAEDGYLEMTVPDTPSVPGPEVLRHKAFPNFIFRIQNVTVLQRLSEDGYLKMTVPNI